MDDNRIEQYLLGDMKDLKWAGRILRELKTEGKITQQEYIALVLSLYEEVNK